MGRGKNTYNRSKELVLFCRFCNKNYSGKDRTVKKLMKLHALKTHDHVLKDEDIEIKDEYHFNISDYGTNNGKTFDGRTESEITDSFITNNNLIAAV